MQSLGRQLKIFNFQSDLLEVIDEDLFQFNTNLEHLQLYSNKIKTVEQGAFSNLRELKVLNFYLNPCYSDIASNGVAIRNLIVQIEKNCS